MNKLEALNYIADNGSRGSEWEEAGLAHIFIEVIKSELVTFSMEYLAELLAKAESN
jgi:hypothetical protein